MFAAWILILASCGHTLESESGLYDVELEQSAKLSVKGAWFSGKSERYSRSKSGAVYVSPLTVSAVKDEYPEVADEMNRDMHRFIKEEVGACMNEMNTANNTNWKLTQQPEEADVRIDMAVVHFKPQRPFLRIFTDIASFWSPVPMTSTLVSPASSGDICMELTIRDAATGELLFACKDENRAIPRYYREEAYRKSGNAQSNLRAWARKLARLLREAANDRSGGKSVGERYKEMDILDAAQLKIKAAGDGL